MATNRNKWFLGLPTLIIVSLSFSISQAGCGLKTSTEIQEKKEFVRVDISEGFPIEVNCSQSFRRVIAVVGKYMQLPPDDEDLLGGYNALGNNFKSACAQAGNKGKKRIEVHIATIGDFFKRYSKEEIFRELEPNEWVTRKFWGSQPKDNFPVRDYVKDDEIKDELGKLGFGFANAAELLAFGVAYPDEQQKSEIVTLDGGRYNIDARKWENLYLGSIGGEKRFVGFGYFFRGLPKGTRFAVVRK
ncbi:MAG: hypothetical protein HZB99_00360 [Candidatus Harrisonbacteria bacterium]|nr:hypothetical protein [Candidatus Harrisonbacteria bacterium]